MNEPAATNPIPSLTAVDDPYSASQAGVDASATTIVPPMSLWRDTSFWGITATQFLGAFNDNLYKQLLLLLFVAVPVGNETKDLQWIALLCFSLPFILFSGFAGYLSDRLSKPRVILTCKIAEIAIMGFGVIGFLAYERTGLTSGVLAGMATVLFCMGSHSAFFGPGKFGVLPELFAERNLPAANGVILMTTFLAIILGSALAGLLMHWWSGRLWLAGCVCVAIAGIGVCTALFIRRLRPAAPSLPFKLEVLIIPGEIMRLLRADVDLRRALMASIVFWLAAAIVQPAVNALWKLQLRVDDRWTSLLVTVISLGIAIGCALAGFLSAGKVKPAIQRTGAWGMFGMLLLLSLRGGPNDHLLGYYGSLVVLTILGIFTGMFAVPLQVFLQSKPPPGDKGRMIATQNLLNWIGILLSAVIYFAAEALLTRFAWPNNGVFALTALLVLPIALWYRPAVGRSPDSAQ